MRDLIGSTLTQTQSESEYLSSATVIPIGADDLRAWSQSLTVLYSIVGGVTDDEIWRAVMQVRAVFLFHTVLNVPAAQLQACLVVDYM